MHSTQPKRKGLNARSVETIWRSEMNTRSSILLKDDNKSQESGEKVDTTETAGVKDSKEKPLRPPWEHSTQPKMEE